MMEQFDLPYRIRKALVRNRIKTITDLCDLSDDDILCMRGCGPDTVRQIRHFLATRQPTEAREKEEGGTNSEPDAFEAGYLAAIAQARAESAQDTKRLDWLENRYGAVVISRSPGDSEMEWHCQQGRSLRAAIDAIMAEKGGEG